MEEPAAGACTRPRSERAPRHTLAALALIAIVAAWGYGLLRGGTGTAPLVAEVLPGAGRIESRDGLFVGRRSSDGSVVGYAAVGTAPGYAGPVEVLVGVNPSGEIVGVRVVAQRETPGFWRRLDQVSFLDRYVGATVREPLRRGVDLDAVSGATLSAEAVASAIRQATRAIAAGALDTPLLPEERPIRLGVPEAVLLLLFACGYLGRRAGTSGLKRGIRWGTLLTSMIVLGFVYTAPLTITQVVALLSGYWPDWHSNLYWYLLIGGILFVTVAHGKNPYCSWFCPFGAYQECLAALAGATPYRPGRLRDALRWAQRGLALGAILLGLALRRPGIASYEPFATLFDLKGSGLQWAFLILVTLASLVIYRPFCSYLCPLEPVIGSLGEVRRWLRERRRAPGKRAASG